MKLRCIIQDDEIELTFEEDGPLGLDIMQAPEGERGTVVISAIKPSGVSAETARMVRDNVAVGWVLASVAGESVMSRGYFL